MVMAEGDSLSSQNCDNTQDAAAMLLLLQQAKRPAAHFNQGTQVSHPGPRQDGLAVAKNSFKSNCNDDGSPTAKRAKEDAPSAAPSDRHFPVADVEDSGAAVSSEWEPVVINASTGDQQTLCIGYSGMRNGKRVHQCKQCQKHFPSVSKLVRHSRVHTKDKPFVCDYCATRLRCCLFQALPVILTDCAILSRFTQRSSLKQHMTRHVDHSKPSVPPPIRKFHKSGPSSSLKRQSPARPIPSKKEAPRKASIPSISKPPAESKPVLPIPPPPSAEDAKMAQAQYMRNMVMMGMGMNPLMAQQAMMMQAMMMQQAMAATSNAPNFSGSFPFRFPSTVPSTVASSGNPASSTDRASMPSGLPAQQLGEAPSSLQSRVNTSALVIPPASSGSAGATPVESKHALIKPSESLAGTLEAATSGVHYASAAKQQQSDASQGTGAMNNQDGSSNQVALASVGK